MNKRIYLSLALAGCLFAPAVAQRTMDVLDRGLVAVATQGGVFCSWRINAEEWYDASYNIYRDGTLLNSTPLQISNFTDPDGSASSKYAVAPVVNGVELQKCETVGVLEKNYLTVVPKHDSSLTSTYVPNDACCADVDGDGVLEILMKYDNQSEISASYPRDGHNGEYSLFECLKLDGTVLWWVNCGPNMGDFQNNEQNIVGYDWDRDGKAEVIFRAADGTTIHMADGTVYTVGDPSLNYRGATGGGANWFMHSGKEYLVYADGLTGKPYQCIDYPLPRLEDSENPNGLLSGGAYDDLVNKAWGDGYGHRSSKHFFGAPYLDGRTPSIFIARGIY
ncbi:MAG: rhamnogalacturonate lyase, partial [Muribaculaceae bacterium]|nr:rhamnogalacturonate lyase [Muribaculaceae bacterium]